MSMQWASERTWLRYLAAVLAVAAAMGVRAGLLEALGTHTPFLTFFPAVMIAALYGGLGPGLLAGVLSAFAASYWMEPAGVVFEIRNPAHRLGMAVFLVSCTMISCICEAMRRARSRATAAEVEACVAAERTRGAEVLRESEATNRALLAVVPDLMFRVARDGTYVGYVANQSQELYVPPEQFMGRKVAEVLPAEVGGRLMDCARRALRDGTVAACEYELDMTGDRRWFEARVVGCGNDEVLHIVRDITERKRSEEVLQQSQQRFQTLAAATFEGIAISEGGRLVDVNEQLAKMFGYEAAEMIGMEVAPLITPEYRQRVQESIFANSDLDCLDHRAIRKDGSVFAVEAHARNVVHESRKIRISVVRDITERQRAEESLRQSEARLRAFFEQAAVGTAVADPATGRFTQANAKYCQITGYELPELLRMTFGDVTHPEDRVADRDRYYRLVSGAAREYLAEKRYVRKDGRVIWVYVAVAMVRDAQGRAVQSVGVIQDITDQKRVAEALRESEQRLNRSQAIAHLGSWELDLARDELIWSDEAYRIFGLEPREFGATYEAFLERVHPEDRAAVDAAYSGSVREGKDAYEIEHRIVRKGTGEIRWVHEKCEHVRDAGGRIIRSVGMVLDITERKRAAEALRASEHKFRALTEQMPDFIWQKDRNGVYVFCNKRYGAAVGLTPETIAGHRDEDFYPPELAAKYLEDDQRVLNTGQPLETEERWLEAGQERWLHTGKVALLDEDGQCIGTIGIGRGVTDRKRAEESLRRHSRSLKLLSDSATRLLLEDRPERVINLVFEELAVDLGVELYMNFLVAEEGKHLRLNAYGGIDEQTARRVERLEFGEDVCGVVAQQCRRMSVEDVQHSTDPQTEFVRWLGLRAYVCHPLMARGRLMGTLAFGTRQRDRFSEEELELLRTVCDQVAMALERRRLTDELARRAEDLAGAKTSAEQARSAAEAANAAKDHFLAVLSHELRTPLTPVLAQVSMLQDDGRLDDDLRQNMEMIRRNVEMEARLIDDLLDVTRIARGKVELDKRPIELCTVIKRAVEVCKADIECRRLHFGVDVQGEPFIVEADAARLQQVLWNLLKNAIKFTPEGGCVGVRCRRDGKGQVVVEVKDSGVGIEAEALPRIFDAFEQGQRGVTRQFGGLGLGLTISKALVELHGGVISAHSEGRGKGATFKVRLPVMVGADARSVAPVSKHPGPGEQRGVRPLRILLVEDHGDTARIMKRLLEASGHEVEAAGDVATALRLAGERKFDLLLSDLGLPDRSGVDLMRELRQRGERMAAIALSGYGQEDDVRRSKEAGFMVHLTKPVDLEQLARVIEGVVGEGMGDGVEGKR